MADASRRAAAKPARGGLDNAMFLVTALETLPEDLDGLADRVTVNYPWGSLLRAIVLPDARLLCRLAKLGREGASVDILINVHPLRDTAYAARLGLEGAALPDDQPRLRETYAGAGLWITEVDNVTGSVVRATRWASQLHHAGREVWRIRATRRD